MLALLTTLLLMNPAGAESLPDNFFKNSGIRSTQFVRKIDLCTRVKSTKRIFLINQWEGTNVVPPVEAPATETKKGKKGKVKRVRKARRSKKDPKVKSQQELESVIAQLIHDKEVDAVIMENCAIPLATRFKSSTKLFCEDTVTNRFDFLAATVKKIESEKPILAVYEEQHEEEIMKRIETEKWNCEVYEPKSFKVKKVKKKPHTKEVIEHDDESDDE